MPEATLWVKKAPVSVSTKKNLEQIELAGMKESLTRRMTKAVTQTLRLDQLAQTFIFSAHGCCPTCRLVQPLGKGCRAGCEGDPRRIVSGDEDFFEPIPTALQVIPEDPKKLRPVRVVVGSVGYVLTFAGLLWLLPIEALMLSIAGASAVPLGVAMVPRLKRSPPKTSAVLSPAANVPRLPAPEGEVFEGKVLSVGKQVRSFIDGSKCLSCDLIGTNSKGKTVLCARRGCSFQVEHRSGIAVVRGDVELSAEARTVSAELPPKAHASLGLKFVELADVEWREHILLEGMRVKVYGVPSKMQVPELAAYRDEFADVFESDLGTLVEIVSD